MNTSTRLASVALERGLRQSTVQSYERLMKRLDIWNTDPSQEEALDKLFSIDNPNTRRAAVIALRSIFGWSIKIPKGIPRRYVLPDEDTLRLALMTSPHEARGLLMMYAGLRIGEACAITVKDLEGDRLRVDKQVQQLHRKGQETICRIGPVKASVATVVIPDLLIPYVKSLDETVKPDAVRESIRRAGSKVGIHLNPHQLRHWYATTLLDRGAPVSLVSRAMRHSDPSVTLRTYAQVRDGDVKKFF